MVAPTRIGVEPALECGQKMFSHIGEIECSTFLARDGGEVVALSDDENIILVARREPPGLAQLFSDI